MKNSSFKKLAEVLEKSLNKLEESLDKTSAPKRKPVDQMSWIEIFWPELNRPERPNLWPYYWFHFKTFIIPNWESDIIHYYLKYRYRKYSDDIKYMFYLESLKKHGIMKRPTLHLKKP